MSEQKTYVAIDWGSTNLRAYLLVAEKVDKVYTSNNGVKNILNGDEYPQIISKILKHFNADGELPVLMCGMVGSANGWKNTAYVNCPFSINNIAKNVVSFSSQNCFTNPIYLFPGLSLKDENLNSYGVMRGEEVQLIGALNSNQYNLLVLPGTHTKWVTVLNDSKGTVISSFTTVMTGELYDLLLKHSLLGVEDTGFSIEGFTMGLEESKRSNAVIESLFLARSRRLLGELDAKQVSGYLSGMLIGNEVKTKTINLEQQDFVGLIAKGRIAELYKKAFETYGVSNFNTMDVEEVIINGFNKIANEFFN